MAKDFGAVAYFETSADMMSTYRQKIGALTYSETSALRRIGLDELFSFVGEYAMMTPVAKRGLSLRGFWSRK
jgi:hypothetical protein